MSRTHSLLVWGPGNGQEESRGGGGWTGSKSGSHLDSWSVQPVAGAGDEGIRGREGVLVEHLEADHEHSFARVSCSCGNCGVRY